jgi:predicted DNA-binding transcriptional regulator YafY
MVPNILKILSKAIRERRCIAIRYHDQREIRIVEPHAIYTNEHGELVVDSYQTRGFSASGRPAPFWRPFRLKRIASLTVLQEPYVARFSEGFRPDRLKYRNGLIAIVAPTGSENVAGMPPHALTRQHTDRVKTQRLN